jgi:16S rRNA (uracil1498-N3)-methyltransferase
MVERTHRRSVATFVTTEPLVVGTTAMLGEEASHHLRVRRSEIGDRIGLRDGAGTSAEGTLVRLAKGAATVDILDVVHAAALPAVHLLLPVADRDRMLWLAEKATELGATSWRPVIWKRSRSVSTKGEGKTFSSRVRARMESALGQSGGSWLPAIYPEAPLERAIAALPTEATRIVMSQGHASLATAGMNAAVILAVGPEGGMEDDELALLTSAGFAPASVGATTLRFETAALAALAITTARLHAPDLHDVTSAVLEQKA